VVTKTSQKSKTLYTVGVDLGGTKVATALVDGDGHCLEETRRATVPPELVAQQDPRARSKAVDNKKVRAHINYVVTAIAEAIVEVIDQTPISRIQGIGLASAGPMDLIKGTLENPANFHGWKTVPLVALIEGALAKRKIKKPIYFQNDAMAAALGEGWTGRARGAQTYAMITVGTGIGSGVVLNGRPAQSRGMGSEWGHSLVNAPGLDHSRADYEERTVEGLASGTALSVRAKSRLKKEATAAEVAALAREGDAAAQELFRDASEALAALFYNLSLGVHPEIFVVGGGMLAIKDLFLPRAIDIYRDMMKSRYPKFLVPIATAKLGTRAGVIGAARLPLLMSR
jgi:glucokinase